ncbi:gamma-glutamyltransferase family protein [Sedimenticola sp.]|uniref:gamma-glutamyltransferase family protein n=1 Tax=Sedimenticola sp. TaxID=1940285 RepID=UPI0025884CF8|nr:gamma-glutamyltransferase [Sedimenticola sp.]MCW8905520.1 gamma-glutamyltransferase [Sedimenticola sp.]
MKKAAGIVAAGHPVTARAATEILRAGGNAFDAALAAMFAGCVAEPVLASLGGGGFLTARTAGAKPLLYDFFAQTPHSRPAESELDFYPIVADFGTAQQEFHIGMGSIATPGAIKGAFAIHRDLCRMPLREIIQPACEAARSGVLLNSFQHYIAEIVSPIIQSSPQALQLHASSRKPGAIAELDETVCNPAMADGFEILALEGEELFYQGEMGRQLTSDCHAHGGCLTRTDLESYRVARRSPLTLNYHNTQLFTNPPPAIGGILIAFTLALLEQEKLGRYPVNSADHLGRIGHAMKLTQQLRSDRELGSGPATNIEHEILSSEFIESYREVMRNHKGFSRGTTQISIVDSEGNLASMTLSNGEGSGYVLPGCGIMLNNMLGEEDINPHGFNQWPLNRRIASMMSPSLVITPDGDTIAVGSGGSNRIRSAILQVLVNLLDFGMEIEQAVEQPRMHFESDLLNIEAGPSTHAIQALQKEFANIRCWPDKNLFFGGAHSVMRKRNGQLSGSGDSRRGGVCYRV